MCLACAFLDEKISILILPLLYWKLSISSRSLFLPTVPKTCAKEKSYTVNCEVSWRAVNIVILKSEFHFHYEQALERVQFLSRMLTFSLQLFQICDFVVYYFPRWGCYQSKCTCILKKWDFQRCFLISPFTGKASLLQILHIHGYMKMQPTKIYQILHSSAISMLLNMLESLVLTRL